MDNEALDKLTAAGWQQRFSASGARLAEAIEEYRGLGFEVKTVPVAELPSSGCNVCFEDESDRSMMIFVRPAVNQAADDLFED